jgi:hypothetical protein
MVKTVQPWFRPTLAMLSLLGIAMCGSQVRDSGADYVAPQPGALLEVPTGTTLDNPNGGSLATSATSIFLEAPRPSWPPRVGTTPADEAAVKRQWSKLRWVRGPKAVYSVDRESVRSPSGAPRIVDDQRAIAVYGAIDDTIGKALSRARCNLGRDVISAQAEENVLPDKKALEVLDASGIDAAAYPEIARLGAQAYVRPPNWGREACGN